MRKEGMIKMVIVIGVSITLWIVGSLVFSKRVERVGSVSDIVCQIDPQSINSCKAWKGEFVFSEGAKNSKPLHFVIDNKLLYEKVQQVMNNYGEMKFIYKAPYLNAPFLNKPVTLMDVQPAGQERAAFFSGADVTLPALSNYDGHHTLHLQMRQFTPQ